MIRYSNTIHCNDLTKMWKDMSRWQITKWSDGMNKKTHHKKAIMMIFAETMHRQRRQKGKLCASHYFECIFCSSCSFVPFFIWYGWNWAYIYIKVFFRCVLFLFYSRIDWFNEMQTGTSRRMKKFQIWNSYQPLIAGNSVKDSKQTERNKRAEIRCVFFSSSRSFGNCV